LARRSLTEPVRWDIFEGSKDRRSRLPFSRPLRHHGVSQQEFFMTTRVCLLIGTFSWAAIFASTTSAPADEAAPAAANAADEKPSKSEAAGDKVKADTPSSSSSTSSTGSSTSSAAKPKYPSHTEVLKDFKKIEGLIPLYQKDTKLYAEIA